MKIKSTSRVLLILAVLFTFSMVACTKSTSPTKLTEDKTPITYLDDTDKYIYSGLNNPDKACYGYSDAEVVGVSSSDIVVVWEDINSDTNNESGYKVSWMGNSDGTVALFKFFTEPDETMAILSSSEFPPQNVVIEAYKNEGGGRAIRASEGLELTPCEKGVVDVALGVFPTATQREDGIYVMQDGVQSPYLTNDITNICVAPYPMENYPDASIIKWVDTNSDPNESSFEVRYRLKFDCNSIPDFDEAYYQALLKQDKEYAEDYKKRAEEDAIRKAKCFAEFENDDEFGYRSWDSEFLGDYSELTRVQKDFTEFIIPEGWKMVSELTILPSTSELLNGFVKNWGTGAGGSNPQVSACPPDTVFDGALQNDDGSYDYDEMPKNLPYAVVGLCKTDADYGIMGISDPTTLNWGDTNNYPYNESGYKITLRDANGREFLLDSGDDTPIDYSMGGIEAYLDMQLSSVVVSRASGFSTVVVQPYYKSSAETSPNEESVYLYGEETTFVIQNAPNCMD